MSCVVHVENAPQERRILFGMFGGRDREMRMYASVNPLLKRSTDVTIVYIYSDARHTMSKIFLARQG
jgi:hypothetical protein